MAFPQHTKSKSKFLPSTFLVNRATPISVLLAFGPHSYASTVNATVGAGHLVALWFHSHALSQSAEC